MKPLSRIPSPVKELVRNDKQKEKSQIATAGRSLLGHTRQRSLVTPAVSSQLQPAKHTRSTSTVSATRFQSAINTDKLPSKLSSEPRQRKPAKSVQESNRLSKPIATIYTSSLESQTADIGYDPLRRELLQLTIVLSQSQISLKSYEKSTQQSLVDLSKRYSEELDLYSALSQEHTIAANLNILEDWIQQHGEQRTCQFIQDLSVLVRDLAQLEDKLIEPNDGLLSRFGKCVLLDKLANSDTGQLDAAIYCASNAEIEKQILPELSSISRHLKLSADFLSSLPPAGQSTLASCIRLHSSLVNTMLAECSMALELGVILCKQYKSWREGELEAGLAVQSMDRSSITSFLV